MEGYEKLLNECNTNLEFYTKHLENLRKFIAVHEEFKKISNSTNLQQDNSEFIEMELFSNYNGYITISILELTVSLKNLMVAKSNWEKIFFIKNAYLVIHETINRLNPPNEKEWPIRPIIDKNYPELQKDFSQLINDLKTFRNGADYKKIEITRHSTAGHIDKSLKRYYDTVQKLDGEEAAKFISRFIGLLNRALLLTRDYSVLAKKIQLEKSKAIDENVRTLLEKLEVFFKK